MYSKSEVESVAVAAKEASFMDRLYMKIEAICVEADKNPSLVFQEASKYVETQVTTVGSSMRKLCSDLIRDLIPPPMEELTECKHADNCTCKSDEAASKSDEATTRASAAAAAACEPPVACATPAQSSIVMGTSRANGEVKKPEEESSQSKKQVYRVEDNDTIVEEGEQSAEWYVSADYRRGLLHSNKSSDNLQLQKSEASVFLTIPGSAHQFKLS